MSGIELLPVRRLVAERPQVRVTLLPGDRIVAAVGATVAAGDLLAERVRDPRLVEAGDGDPQSGAVHPGAWIAAEAGRRGTAPAGELLFEHGGRRRIATGPHPDLVSAPAAGRVVAVRPGVDVVLEIDGIGIPGSELLGDPGHGRLALLPGDGEGRIPLEVAHAGAIVVFPGRADAETLTRARAMGIAGAVVPALAERDRRDVVASEARQRAGLHRLPPFPVLVLDGYLRRTLARPMRDLLATLDGEEVGLAGGPPLLLAAARPSPPPQPAPDHVRLRGGPHAGHEGRFLGLAGPHRLAAGVVSEAARVRLSDGREVIVGLGDLERFA
jgi:hypothetical protein